MHSYRPQRLDPCDPAHRDEIASAFGDVAAWRAAVETYKRKEAKETDRNRKRKLRLMLYSAETQLALAEGRPIP